MLQSRCLLRLVSVRRYRRNYASAQINEEPGAEPDPKHNKTARYHALLQQYDEKITWNSHLESARLRLSHMKLYIQQQAKYKEKLVKELEIKSLPPLPIALKYVVGKEQLLQDEKDEEIDEEPHNPTVEMPYSKVFQFQYEAKKESPPISQRFDRSNIDNWMTNYEYFDDTVLERHRDEEDSDDELDLQWSSRYGTADPDARVSRVQCGGCGAFLHCTDTAIPGYIPSEIFNKRTEEELRAIECQRCHFLKEYNIALNVSVHPDEYTKLLCNINSNRALIIVMVDLLDYPCSIWPDIIDVVGTKRPIFIVGNKVDLIPGDRKGYLHRIKESLFDEIKKTRLGEANIKHIALISAKTGFGVEELISTLFTTWLYKGDVYLIGCTNVGKSSLFNAMLQSDYCKVHAVDIIKRATVSRWPGTTLNLLKFPINRPSGWKIRTRNERLKETAKTILREKALQASKDSDYNKIPKLIGHIGRSFTNVEQEDQSNDPFSAGSMASKYLSQSGINDKDKLFKEGRWFYDTPGVVHPDQILSLLTAEELLQVLPKSVIRPQTYYLREGTTILIGGIARLDFVECTKPVRFTVFCSKHIPITITFTRDADEIYEKFLGTDLLMVPHGNPERLAKWPGLTQHKETITLTGEGDQKCCADVVLSSAGWIATSAPFDVKFKVNAWTPEGRGINVRKPSMTQFAVLAKGSRIRDSPAYRLGRVYIGEN